MKAKPEDSSNRMMEKGWKKMIGLNEEILINPIDLFNQTNSEE